MKLRLILLGVSILIFGGGLAAGILWNKEYHAPWLPFGAMENGKPYVSPVPQEILEDFALEFRAMHTAQVREPLKASLRFSGAGGEYHKLSEFYGGESENYLLLNLWATWCAPCVLELPSLEQLKEAYEGNGLAVLAVSIDHARGLEEIETFLETRGIGRFALYLDDAGEIKESMPARGIPTSFLISPQGEVLYVFEGDADWSGARSKAFFDSLLSEKQ